MKETLRRLYSILNEEGFQVWEDHLCRNVADAHQRYASALGMYLHTLEWIDQRVAEGDLEGAQEYGRINRWWRKAMREDHANYIEQRRRARLRLKAAERKLHILYNELTAAEELRDRSTSARLGREIQKLKSQIDYAHQFTDDQPTIRPTGCAQSLPDAA